ncbi:uncharacterized protein LOC130441376 [Diorhabda sublineata]|uniref:uncharacterized protein LOC130441376 n=1 Tax=Diorhabda sublineata TaxID=1163346 RepID=UPI0024E0877B|nr:uncharacterized protein LOC130441376 [Diorhabda sublineata]
MVLETFHEFCKHLYHCAEKLENELKGNIDDSNEMITNKETIDVKLPLQKVKVYHYNEIIKLIKHIETDLKKILYHEECVIKLEKTKKLSGEELQHYCSTGDVDEQNSINDKSFVRRQRRRAASEVSLYTLSTWEAYLQKKSEEENNFKSESASGLVEIPKRNKPMSKRKKKKFVSSTFNDILEIDSLNKSGISDTCTSIIEDDEYLDDEEMNKKLSKNYSCSENNLFGKTRDVGEENLRSYVSEAHLESTKPKIVDIVYKKKPNVFDWNNVRNTFYPDSG